MKVKIGKYPKNGPRKASVVIDPEDVWSLDDTLSLVIHPALVTLKKAKAGSPPIANEDVPESMRTSDDADIINTDSWHLKWAWVLDEMIFAFAPGNEAYNDEFNADSRAEIERRANGRRLFAKYFNALWT